MKMSLACFVGLEMLARIRVKNIFLDNTQRTMYLLRPSKSAGKLFCGPAELHCFSIAKEPAMRMAWHYSGSYNLQYAYVHG